MARQRFDAAAWAVLIDAWRRSGLSLPSFCKLLGLSRGTMQNWVYKPPLKLAVDNARCASEARRRAPVATAEPPNPPTAFLPVRLAGVTAPTTGPKNHTAIEVILGGGRRIVVSPGFDPEMLRQVVAALEA